MAKLGTQDPDKKEMELSHLGSPVYKQSYGRKSILPNFQADLPENPIVVEYETENT
ncbi:hypothetical protein OnM2_041024 [Erysiphe neolycopersici]|uniref:Uncharacterized protein n=1 Tax=Erysiphe neolycopersici TaxID=212602 RepID=A0A420HW22_9PEZI|nr:hypothetical protein OnM2_041024 [Erysiphe neolycopersici]